MENIPVEVITHILKYLPSLKDRKVCSLVCRLWYEAYQDPIFRHYEVLCISEENRFQALLDLKNSARKYFHVVIKGFEITESSLKFWERYGPSIRNLTIVSCDIREKIFVKILSLCEQLEALCVQSCRELFMVGDMLEDDSVRLILKEKLVSLKTLNLSYNRYLSDIIFSRFILIFPNLRELFLSGCQISFFSGLYKKYYPDEQLTLSRSVLTFPVILSCLQHNIKALKSLTFNDTLIDNAAVFNLSQAKDLELTSLNLRGCLQLSNIGIVLLSHHQKSLTQLDVSMCPRITDSSLLAVCTGLSNLQSLSVQSCRAISDYGISCLYKLEKLRYLNISKCDLILGDGIIKGICNKINPRLRELHMGHLGNITDNVVICLSESLPNLTILDLGFCFDAVTDKAVQSILKNNSNLQTLILNQCHKLTDSGLTGRGLQLNSSYENGQETFKLSLGSKVEQEIIREAKLKQEVQEICENSSDFSGVSLQNLKGLQNLNLEGCNGVSDISLIYAFHFNELRHLNLSRCNKITEKGLRHLSLNSRTIEFLNLELCQNVDNEGVFHVVKNLKRLETLILGSNKITDSVAKILAQNNNLTYLDIKHCGQISLAAINEISTSLTNLQNFHFSSFKNWPDNAQIPVPPEGMGLWLIPKS